MKIHISIALISVSFATTAFGFSVSPIPKAGGAKAAHSSGNESAASDCANFAGAWKGSCTEQRQDGDEASSETRDETLVIEQNECKSMTIDSLKFHFGGSTSTTETSPTDSESFTIFTDWNESKSVILSKISFQGRSLGSNNFDYVTRGNGTGSMRLVDGALHSDMDFSYFVDAISGGNIVKASSREICVYAKDGSKTTGR